MSFTTKNSLNHIFKHSGHHKLHKGSPKFVDGWKRIREISQEDRSASYVKAQVFYYSRHVEPVNLQEYCEWLKSSQREVIVPDLVDEGTKDDSATLTEMTVKRDVTDKHPANFGELIHMVQQGIKVPGVEELNIEPTNENPTPAKLDRPKKPWEM